MPYSLQSLLLLAFAVLFGVVFLLIVVAKALARRERGAFLDLLLLFLTTLLTVLALALNALDPQPGPWPPLVALAAGGVLVVAGILVLPLELRRPARWRGARGIVSLWAGVLVLLSTALVPRLAGQMLAPEPDTAIGVPPGEVTPEPGTPEATATVTASPFPTNTPLPTATLTPFPSRTRRPTSTPTITRTPFRYQTRTPVPSPTFGASCPASSGVNLRLRAAPGTDAETLAVIPFGTSILAIGRNADSSWWYVLVEGQTGWVSADFLDLDAGCDELPVQPAR